MRREYKSSKRKLGAYACLEHRDNPAQLVLFGRGGYLCVRGDVFIAVIEKAAYKLRTPHFSDYGDNVQVISVSELGLEGMLRHLEVPKESSQQMRIYKRSISLGNKPQKTTKSASKLG